MFQTVIPCCRSVIKKSFSGEVNGLLSGWKTKAVKGDWSSQYEPATISGLAVTDGTLMLNGIIKVKNPLVFNGTPVFPPPGMLGTGILAGEIAASVSFALNTNPGSGPYFLDNIQFIK